MRRILLLLAVAALMLTLVASPALAVAREPTEDGPGDPQSPGTSPAEPTESAGKNCYGFVNSNFLKGPGGNPGSLADPTVFEGEPNYTGHAVSSINEEDPGEISEFQLAFKDAAAGKSC